MAQTNKLDPFSGLTILAFVAAFLGDISFFLIVTHYFFGVFVLAAFWHQTRGFLAKAALVAGFLLPGPFFLLGSVLAAIALSNKLIAVTAEIAIQQVAIQTLAVVTGGGAEVLEGVVIAGEAAEVGVAAVEAAEVAGGAAEAIGGAGEVAEGVGGIAEEAGENAASDSVGNKFREKASEKLKDKLRGGDKDNGEDDGNEESDDDRRQRESEEAYEQIMETEAERPPMEQVEEELFSERGPVAQRNTTPGSSSAARPAAPKETDAQRRLRERFEKAQRTHNQLTKAKPSHRIEPADAGGEDADETADEDESGNASEIEDAA
jgi:hypothetical protein